MTFVCHNCGIRMHGQRVERCPFCEAADLMESRPQANVVPDVIVPFQTTRADILAALLKRADKELPPAHFRTAVENARIDGVYLPHWLLDADAHAMWQGKIEVTERRADGETRTEWQSDWGQQDFTYRALGIPAIDYFTEERAEKVGSFPAEHVVPYDASSLDHPAVEHFSISREEINARCRDLVLDKITRTIAHPRRQVQVRTTLHSVSVKAGLVPLWIVRFEHKGKKTELHVNGATGWVPKFPVPPSAQTLAFMWGFVAVLAIAVYACNKMMM